MIWTADQLPRLDGRTAIVTGGNSGIGLHTVRALAAAGARVVLACRDIARGERIAGELGGDIEARPLDLASMQTIRAFTDAWTGPLDVLVNNAGVMAPPRFGRTVDGYELQFGTNHLGHFVLTGLLLPALLGAPAARVVTVSSIVHHKGSERVVDGNAGPGYDPQQAYAESKLANLLFALELQRQASRRRLPLVSVAAHPGVSATGLFSDRQGMGASRTGRLLGPAVLRLAVQSAAAGARPSLFAATLAEPGSYTGPTRLGETRGKIGAARLSSTAQDERLAARLWRVSEELTGLRYEWPAEDPAPAQ